MTDLLDGRRVLVTGASSGIGEAIAGAVVDAGGSVALVARSADRLDELADRWAPDAVAAPADVTEPASIRQAVDVAVESLGGLDAVVCSAGLVRPGGILDASPADWRAMFDVNVNGLLNTVHACVGHLLRSAPADIVSISSMSGRRRSSVALGFYAASKFAVHVASDSLREELGEHGVRVTVVSPGYVDTPIFDGLDDDATRERYQEAVRTQGLSAGDVAAQVVHALAQPAGVDLVEIAMLSTEQR